MTSPAAIAQARRTQRYAYAALAVAFVLAAAIARLRPASLGGVELPALAPLALVLLGAIACAVAAARRAPTFALAGAGVMLVGLLLPDGESGLGDLALATLFGVALVAHVELVHVSVRYSRAQRAADSVSEEGLRRVTDETLRTLAARLGLAALVVGAGLALAQVLARVGPRQWREAVEVPGVWGFALATLAILAGVSLFILTRGAKLREPTERAHEVEIDVAE